MTLLEQVLFALYPGRPGRMLELGAKFHRDKGPYKALFEFEGWEHVSVDLNGLYGALPMDLQEPLNLGKFDLVTNFGTTEHVEDQEAVWANIHHAIKYDGLLISTTPAPRQWPGHGKYYPPVDWYREFATLNGYELWLCRVFDQGVPARDMVGAVMLKVEDVPFNMPQTQMYVSEGGKVGAYT